LKIYKEYAINDILFTLNFNAYGFQMWQVSSEQRKWKRI